MLMGRADDDRQQGLLSPPLGRWTHSPWSLPKWESGGDTPRNFLKNDADFGAFGAFLALLTDSLDSQFHSSFFSKCVTYF